MSFAKTITTPIFSQSLDELVATLELSSTTISKKPNRKEVLSTPPLVHYYDRNIVTELGLNLTKGPWVAGGAALSWYNNESVGSADIDIFCRTEAQQAAMMHLIAATLSGSIVFDSASAKTYEIRDSESSARTHTLQVITKCTFSSPQDIIDNFDISVCQVVTDGYKFRLGENTASDIRNKILRMKTPLREDSVKRMIKYWCYGYTPTEDLFSEIQTSASLNWDFKGQEGDYLNAF